MRCKVRVVACCSSINANEGQKGGVTSASLHCTGALLSMHHIVSKPIPAVDSEPNAGLVGPLPIGSRRWQRRLARGRGVLGGVAQAGEAAGGSEQYV